MNSTIIVDWLADFEPVSITITAYRAVRISGWFVTNRIVFPRCSGGNPANTYNTFQ